MCTARHGVILLIYAVLLLALVLVCIVTCIIISSSFYIVFVLYLMEHVYSMSYII
jgi:hypothetical protein